MGGRSGVVRQTIFSKIKNQLQFYVKINLKIEGIANFLQKALLSRGAKLRSTLVSRHEGDFDFFSVDDQNLKPEKIVRTTFCYIFKYIQGQYLIIDYTKPHALIPSQPIYPHNSRLQRLLAPVTLLSAFVAPCGAARRLRRSLAPPRLRHLLGPAAMLCVIEFQLDYNRHDVKY